MDNPFIVMDPSPRYKPIVVWMHWIVAVLIIINLMFGLEMEHFTGYPHSDPEWSAAFFWHSSIGLTVLVLALVRLYLRLTRTPPALPHSITKSQAVLSGVIHWLFYALMIAVPQSGYVHRMAGGKPVSFFGLFDMPQFIQTNESLRLLSGQIHVVLTMLMLALLMVHVLGVLKHLWIDKVNLMDRMRLGKRDPFN